MQNGAYIAWTVGTGPILGERWSLGSGSILVLYENARIAIGALRLIRQMMARNIGKLVLLSSPAKRQVRHIYVEGRSSITAPLCPLCR